MLKTEGKLHRRYKAGYEVWDEIWRTSETDNSPLPMRSAYTPDGSYIGDTRTAYRLCLLRGIAPEKRSEDHVVCSIGFCEREQKWFGWSHRALFGFGVGSQVVKGDCAYEPTDEADFRDDMIRFWDSEDHVETWAVEERGEDGELGVLTSWRYGGSVPNEQIRGTISGVFMPYPAKFGRGEWTAETLDDAKIMAEAFAEGVS